MVAIKDSEKNKNTTSTYEFQVWNVADEADDGYIIS